MHEQPTPPALSLGSEVLTYYRASNALTQIVLWSVFTAVVLGVARAAGVEDFVPWIASMAGLSALSFAWFVLILPPLELRFRRYELTQSSVYLQRGFFTRRRTIVPYDSVQSVTTVAGPLARRWDLSTVQIQTAAHAETITMLNDEVAEELRDRVSDFARRSARGF